MTVQGRRLAASLIGFVEVSLFIAAVATVVRGPLDMTRILAYGSGFAAGTFVGVTVERMLGLGEVVVRAITCSYEALTTALTEAGFGVTVVDGRGGHGTSVGVVFSVCRRTRLAELLRVASQVDSGATVTVEDVRQRLHGYFAPKRPATAALHG